MTETVNGQNLSGGWNAEIVKFRPGQHEWDWVVEDTELATVLATWLDLITNTDADIAIIEKLGELIGDNRPAEEVAEDPDGIPDWTVPLNIDRLAELVTGGRYLCSQFEVDGERYQITVDYSDF